MADFATSVALSFEIDDAELRAARDDIESELGGVSVDVDAGGAGSAVPDGGLDMGTLTELADERNDILDDMLDELEGGTFGGGGGGGGGLPIPGLGGGGDGGGFGLLEALGAGSLARLLPAISGGTAAAAGAGAGLPLIGGAIAKRFGGAPSIPSGALTQSPLFALLAGGANAAGALSNLDLGAGGVTPGAGGPGPDVGAGIGEPSPEFQRLIEQFDSAVSSTPAWLSQFSDAVNRLTAGPTTQRDTGIDRTEGGDLRLSRLAGNPSGATGIDRTEGGDRVLARAAANQRADDRADRGPDARRGRPNIDVSVEAEGVDRREVERAMDEAKQEAVREVERQFRQFQRPGGS